MKVSIGKYINRWTTSNFEEWYIQKRTGKKIWEVTNSDLTKVDLWVEKLCDIWQVVLNSTVNKCLDYKARKIKVKIHKYDTLNMENTLAIIILPMLKQLKKTKQGSPLIEDLDVPKELRSTSAPMVEGWKPDDNFYKRWDWVLEEMIWAFEQIVDDSAADQFHSGNVDIETIPVDKHGNEVELKDAEGFKMRKTEKDTYVFNKEGYSKYQKRINNGLMLFGKYYQALGD